MPTMESPDKWLERMTSSLKAFSSYKQAEQKFTFMELFRDIAKKHGREKAERGILAAIGDPNRHDRQFIPAPGDFWDYAEKTPSPDALPRLYDSHCAVCIDGWEEIGFEKFPPRYKNKIETLYGHTQGMLKTAMRRCSVCWKGSVTQ